MGNNFLLINSPIFWDSTSENEAYLSPLGLGYIATYLKKSGINVVIKDCVKEKIGVEQIVDYINSNEYSHIGINIFSPNYKIVKNIVESITSNSTIYIGGQTVKSIYKDIMQWKTNNKTRIIIGEGELIIPALVSEKCCEKPIEKNDNICVYRVDSKSRYYPANLSDIVLNHNLLNDEIIINPYGKKEAAIITSRGCPFNCTFCGGARDLNPDIEPRIRNNDSIIRELSDIINIYPSVESIRILDDLFLRNGNSILEAQNIFSNFPQLEWRAMAHVVPLSQNLDKINILKASHCRELFIGIESGSEDIRKKINKLGDIETILSVAKRILEEGINLKGYFIYGFPNENYDDFEKTYNLACRIKDLSYKTEGKFRTSVFQFRPYNGTKLYNELMNEYGILEDFVTNNSINIIKGRRQFNFASGNYSSESYELLNSYIIKTQNLSR